MNANTRKLHDLGQRLWLDNITRDLLDSGTLARYIADLSATGLTSNPTIFEHAISSGASYDDAIRKLAARGLSEEGIFFELALQDLTRAADLFRPVFDASDGVDGWVSLEVSPLLAGDTAGTIRAAADGVLENRRVGSQPGHRQIGDVARQRAAVQQVTRDVVEPQALALVVQLSGVGIHGVSSGARLSRRSRRSRMSISSKSPMRSMAMSAGG